VVDTGSASAPTVDPFQERDGLPARAARRLGCTEGQLYSLAVGLLATWVISANALPNVAWQGAGPQPFLSGAALAAPAVPDAGAPLPTVVPPPVAGPAPLSELGPQQPLADPFAPLPAPAPAFPEPGPGAPPPQEPVGAPAPRRPGPQPVVQPAPVSVVSGGYASARAGTPLATFGVPQGSVAVAAQAGQIDKVSYLRLTGAGEPLELLVDPEGMNRLDPLAGLTLCFVTTPEWKVGQGDVAPEDGPAYDCTNGIEGARSPAGDPAGERWNFDVSRVDLTTVLGVAIVPTTGPLAPDFQIVFRIEEPRP
jgi:hypothetical protein